MFKKILKKIISWFIDNYIFIMLKFKLSPWFIILKIIFFWVITRRLVKIENF
jgi:hypothetical protein